MTKHKGKRNVRVTDEEALRFEKIHQLMNEHAGKTEDLIAALKESGVFRRKGVVRDGHLNWQALQKMMETDEYKAWRVQKMRLMKNMSELRGLDVLSQALSTEKAIQVAQFLAQGKVEITPSEPATNPHRPSERKTPTKSAALIGATSTTTGGDK